MSVFAIVVVLVVVLFSLWVIFSKRKEVEVDELDCQEVVVVRVIKDLSEPAPVVKEVASKKIATKKVATNKVVAKKGK